MPGSLVEGAISESYNSAGNLSGSKDLGSDSWLDAAEGGQRIALNRGGCHYRSSDAAGEPDACLGVDDMRVASPFNVNVAFYIPRGGNSAISYVYDLLNVGPEGSDTNGPPGSARWGRP